nr:class I SAM-dependent methyltransferase [uncultured Cohaesibacter sp.]
MAEASPPTTLEDRIKRMIRATGPLSVADYMSLCLADPQAGYYTTRAPIGTKGDFVTAPEVSQLFGELIGIWMLAIWQQSGRPAPFHLVELGPGRGTLMADMVRAIAIDPEATENLILHLVEISPSLRKEQEATLSAFEIPKQWHQSFETLPKAPLFIVGNEFFDCLPIHQQVFHHGRWHERVVGLDDNDRLSFGVGPVRAIAAPEESTEEGVILEHSPASEAMMSTIAAHLAIHGGAGLFIDYGYDAQSYGDTFQAMRNHAYADPLQDPGACDLTAHVNFSALSICAIDEISNTSDSKICTSPIMSQGEFLLAMGLLERAGQLGAGCTPRVQDEISKAVERLAAPQQMGSLFKCLALMPAVLPLPPLTFK